MSNSLLVLDKVEYILTDVEGTTTSVSFVYDVLFPYFRAHISELKNMSENEVVKSAFNETKSIVLKEETIELKSTDEIIKKLNQWCEEDRKITPLKTLQGLLWKIGYEQGVLKGHVYDDVPIELVKWQNKGLKMGVFSSGSIEAQKLIFGYSEKGDLTRFFSNYFDTKTGMKRVHETYLKIALELKLNPGKILFLSDIVQELEAAHIAGFQTIQLVRQGTKKEWENSVTDFTEIKIDCV
ncbi:MAG: acireductone synthase [Bacteroidetes bacterium]|nr:acireductone synthase [Bacteroidota bacterium]